MRELSIIYIGTEKTSMDLYRKSIQEKNKLSQDTFYDNAYEANTYTEGMRIIEKYNPDIVVLDDTTADYFEAMTRYLQSNTQMRIILIISPKNYKNERMVLQLQADYPLAVIDVVFKPIQPADLWTFLDTVKQAPEKIKWEDGDFDDF